MTQDSMHKSYLSELEELCSDFVLLMVLFIQCRYTILALWLDFQEFRNR